mmetsp:Transcript_11478/g.43083  ORF Transcript_11478/g.43083 Transcript_11478/m.43083 type:complete len:218 (-) Transcript_11478:322-975(-)
MAASCSAAARFCSSLMRSISSSCCFLAKSSFANCFLTSSSFCLISSSRASMRLRASASINASFCLFSSSLRRFSSSNLLISSRVFAAISSSRAFSASSSSCNLLTLSFSSCNSAVILSFSCFSSRTSGVGMLQNNLASLVFGFTLKVRCFRTVTTSPRFNCMAFEHFLPLSSNCEPNWGINSNLPLSFTAKATPSGLGINLGFCFGFGERPDDDGIS